MSLEQIAAGLFAFDPTRSLQAGTSMGAQMMDIALREQQMKFQVAADATNAQLSSERNALARRSQMFNELTENLNRFDRKAAEQQAASFNQGLVDRYAGGGGSGGASGGGSYPGMGGATYSEASSQPADPSPTPQYVETPGDSFNAVANSSPIQQPPSDFRLPDAGIQAPAGGFSSVPKKTAEPEYSINSDFNATPTQIAAPKPKQDAIRIGVRTQPSTGNFAFNVDTRTRDQINRASSRGNRLISLDYNSSSSGGNYAMIVIPNDADESERTAANNYVNRVTEWMRGNGVQVADPVVKTSRENGRGVGGFFHTEPAFVENPAALGLIRDKGGEYASILAETLGRLPGATFIAPHQTNDPGASGNGFPGERDFARQFILPHLQSMRGGGQGQGGGIAGTFSAYSPRRGASNVSGSGGEGGYASSRPGPDGVAEVRTLDDFANGRSGYITIAGNPSLYGREYTIPSIPYDDGAGNVRTLNNVRAVVHDTGSAFSGAPEGRFDIPISRDASRDLMARNHALWTRENPSLLPFAGERVSPQPIGNHVGPTPEPTNLPQLYGPQETAPTASPPVSPEIRLPEQAAVEDAWQGVQSTLLQKIQSVQKLSELRARDLELQVVMRAINTKDPLWRMQMNQLGIQRARVAAALAAAEENHRGILQREKTFAKSLLDAEAAFKVASDRQKGYQQAIPGASQQVSPEDVFNRYVDADPRTRMQMKASFVEDPAMIKRLEVADEFLKSNGSLPDDRSWKIGGSDYTLPELVEFYEAGNLENPVTAFVDKDPKLKREVVAAGSVTKNVAPASGSVGIGGSLPPGITIQGDGAPASVPVGTGTTDAVRSKIDRLGF